jgi:DNA-binding NarL/FixJ family response regulator
MYETSLPQLLLICRDAARTEQWRAQIAAGGRHDIVAVGRSAVEAATLVTQMDPDAIVCELQLLDGRAIDLVRGLRRGTGFPGLMILIIAPSADNPDLRECLRHGADSYFVDQGPGPSLDSRIHEMLQGESKMSPEIARDVLDHFRRSGPLNQGVRPVDEMLNPLLLTSQDRSILVRLSQGQSVPDIASAEKLRIPQVARCIRALYRKMEWDLRAGSLQLTQF